MKKQLIYLCFLLAFAGCQEDEFDTYTGGNYLSFYHNPSTDSIVETFFFHFGKNRIEVPVKFTLSGPLLPEDRPIRLSIVDSLSGLIGADGRLEPLTEADFEFPDPMVFHRGVNEDSVFVILKKTPKLDNAYCRVVLNIEENAYFQVGMTAHRQAKIYFTSQIETPAWWDDNMTKYYLGEFSVKKYELFCQEVGVTDLTGVEEKYVREYALKFKRFLEKHPEYGLTVTVNG